MADLATLQTRLNEAELAEHKLMVGGGVASVNYEGRGSVTYARADLAKLQAYIAALRAQIAALQGCTAGRQRPIHFGF
jgi:hypothetical protein